MSREAIREIRVDLIDPSPFQPRQVFDERALRDLAASIKAHGVQEPIVVRQIGVRFELIMGERRVRAAKLAELDRIPAVVRDIDDTEAAELAVIENLLRVNLDALEEAGAYQQLLDRLGAVAAVARAINVPSPEIRYKLDLLKLIQPVKDALRAGLLTVPQAHEFIRLSEAGQEQALKVVRRYGAQKVQRIVSALLEAESQGVMFDLSERKLRADQEASRRFHQQLDTAAAALAKCFQSDEPLVLEWVLLADLTAALPKVNALLSTLTALRRQILRSDSRRVAVGLKAAEEGVADARPKGERREASGDGLPLKTGLPARRNRVGVTEGDPTGA
jgi:ParB family chromosome partitioning protein